MAHRLNSKALPSIPEGADEYPALSPPQAQGSRMRRTRTGPSNRPRRRSLADPPPTLIRENSVEIEAIIAAMLEPSPPPSPFAFDNGSRAPLRTSEAPLVQVLSSSQAVPLQSYSRLSHATSASLPSSPDSSQYSDSETRDSSSHLPHTPSADFSSLPDSSSHSESKPDSGPPDVLDMLQAVFDMYPPHLRPSRGARTGLSSREPGFYDKHLHRRLILKKIVILPSLNRDLANVVDDTLQDLVDRNVTLPLTGLMSEETLLEKITIAAKKPMIDESSVSLFYNNTTATFCSPIASTLAIHPEVHKWSEIIGWSLGDSAAWAIADGKLEINYGTGRMRDDRLLRESLPEHTRKELEEIVKRSPSLGVWEIKSLSVGREGVMRNLGRLNGPFKWKNCPARKTERCGRTTGGRDHAVTISDYPDQRPDALHPPWRLPGGDQSDPSDYDDSFTSESETEPELDDLNRPPRLLKRKKGPSVKDPITAGHFVQQVT